MKRIKIFENFLNENSEDLGLNDQNNIMQSIHKQVKWQLKFNEPKTIFLKNIDNKNTKAAPGLDEVLKAVEIVLKEYKTNKKGLTNKTAKDYYKIYFPEWFESMSKLFSPKNN